MLGVKLCNIKLENPLILASGILGISASIMSKISEHCTITTKSIGPVERMGNNNPTVLEWEHGLINAVGLPNAGYKNMEEELNKLSKLKKPWIVSLYGNSISDYAKLTEWVNDFSPSMIEMNLSCPNKSDGTLFSTDPKLSKKLISKIRKKTKIPIIAKLTPNVTNIAEIAKACESGGADAINAINTVLGMSINIDIAKPVLGFKTGGLSGPAIKPIAIRCIYQIYEVVSIPIIGTGGIMTGEDAIEMMMAGASATGVGSAVYYLGQGVFKKIEKEMQDWLKKKGYRSVKEIIGLAHG